MYIDGSNWLDVFTAFHCFQDLVDDLLIQVAFESEVARPYPCGDVGLGYIIRMFGTKLQ